VATKRNFLESAAGRFSGEGAGYTGDNTSQKKSGDTVQIRSSGFLHKSFLGQATGWDHNQSGFLELKFVRI